MNNSSVRVDRLVIGAGLAGLTAAHAFQARGLTVQVVEKSRGPGGRLSSKRLENGSADMGAQYFTARDPAFQRCVQTWIDTGVAAVWQPQMGVSLPDRIEPSPDTQIRYVGTPRMSAITRHLSDGLRVTYDTRIVEVGDGFALSESGQRFEFDQWVSTVPSDQAQAWTPSPLPRQAPCWAVLVKLDRDLEVDGLFMRDHPVGFACHDSSKPGRNHTRHWVLHATPEWSAQWLEQTDTWVGSTLARAFGERVDATADVIKTHRWRFARPWTATQTGVSRQLSGDWTHGGRVEGAFLAGLASAAD